MGNIFQTPTFATPWAIPATLNHPRLFFTTSARLALLQSKWASPPAGPFTTLVNFWKQTTGTGPTSALGHALKYLATGNPAEASAAMTAVTGEGYLAVDFSKKFSFYAAETAFVLDWCYPALTAGQISTLVGQLNTQCAGWITDLPKSYGFPSNVNQASWTGYVCAAIAGEGEVGFNTQATNVRNMVQNIAGDFDESLPSGDFKGYDYTSQHNLCGFAAYLAGTGNESLASSRMKWLSNRTTFLSLMLAGDLSGYYPLQLYDHYINGYQGDTGVNTPAGGTTGPGTIQASGGVVGDAWVLAMLAGIISDPLAAYLFNTQITNNQTTANGVNRWLHESTLDTEPTWLGFLMPDATTLPPLSPSQKGIPLRNRWVDINGAGTVICKGGYNPATDVHFDICYDKCEFNQHDSVSVGTMHLRVNDTMLIADGFSYSGTPSNWGPNAPTKDPTEVGSYTVVGSGLSFTPAGDTHLDRHGAAFLSATVPPGGDTDYPIHFNLQGPGRTYEHGVITSWSDNGTIAQFVADFSKGWSSVAEIPGGARLSAGTSQVGFIRGNTSQKCTIVIWDQFTTGPLTIDRCARNFWFKGKPQGSSETVLQGSSSAGVLALGGDNVIYEDGGFRVTIQIVSVFDQIYAVGGSVGSLPSPATDYTSFLDGYETGGANLAYAANSQGGVTDNRVKAAVSYIARSWRAHFKSSYATNNHEMIYVITVDNQGVPAPVYNRTTALALFGAPPPPVDIGRPVENFYRTDPFPRRQPKQETVFNQGVTPAPIPVINIPFCSSYPME